MSVKGKHCLSVVNCYKVTKTEDGGEHWSYKSNRVADDEYIKCLTISHRGVAVTKSVNGRELNCTITRWDGSYLAEFGVPIPLVLMIHARCYELGFVDRRPYL